MAPTYEPVTFGWLSGIGSTAVRLVGIDCGDPGAWKPGKPKVSQWMPWGVSDVVDHRFSAMIRGFSRGKSGELGLAFSHF